MLAYIEQGYLKVFGKRKTTKSVNSFIKINMRLAVSFIIYRGLKKCLRIPSRCTMGKSEKQKAKKLYPTPLLMPSPLPPGKRKRREINSPPQNALPAYKMLFW